MDQTSQKTVPKTKKSEISTFLKSTGFILEMEVADFLKDRGYTVEVNEYFFDYEENKNREIDLIAAKNINKIELVLIIECKQSQDKDWIFICSDKTPKIYYQYVKYSPELQYNKSPDKTEIFNGMHIFNKDILIAQNTIIRNKGGKAVAEPIIRECLKKLPKALVDYVYNNKKEDKRIIYLPLVVFSNQFFSASYDGKLMINEHQVIRCTTTLDSEIYKYKNYFRGRSRILSRDTYETDSDVNIPASETSRDLGSYYIIDFSTKRGLGKYLTIVEKGVNSIDLKKWEIKNEEKDPPEPLLST